MAGRERVWPKARRRVDGPPTITRAAKVSAAKVSAAKVSADKVSADKVI